MIDEQREFQIAQLADGTLEESARAQVEALVASDDEARTMFESYQRLDSMLRETSVSIDNVVTSEQVIGHIDARSARTIRMGWLRAVGSMTAAACVFVMVAGGLRSIWPSQREATESLANAPVIRVRGPMAILAANRPGEAVIHVSIGQPLDLSLDKVALLYDDPVPGGRTIVISGIGRIE